MWSAELTGRIPLHTSRNEQSTWVHPGGWPSVPAEAVTGRSAGHPREPVLGSTRSCLCLPTRYRDRMVDLRWPFRRRRVRAVSVGHVERVDGYTRGVHPIREPLRIPEADHAHYSLRHHPLAGRGFARGGSTLAGKSLRQDAERGGNPDREFHASPYDDGAIRGGLHLEVCAHKGRLSALASDRRSHGLNCDHCAAHCVEVVVGKGDGQNPDPFLASQENGHGENAGESQGIHPLAGELDLGRYGHVRRAVRGVRTLALRAPLLPSPSPRLCPPTFVSWPPGSPCAGSCRTHRHFAR